MIKILTDIIVATPLTGSSVFIDDYDPDRYWDRGDADYDYDDNDE